LISETHVKYEAITCYQFETLLFSKKSHTLHIGELYLPTIVIYILHKSGG